MGNSQPIQGTNGIITLPIRTSSYFHIENMPQWPPFIRGGYRIDQKVWDEFYGHVMSCEVFPNIEKLRTKHTCNLVLMVAAGIAWFAGLMAIMVGGIDMLVEEEDTDWWWDSSTTTSSNSDTDSDYDATGDIITMISGGLLIIFSMIAGFVAMRNDRKNRQKWIKHVRTQLMIKLRYLNAKYDRKLYFMLDQWNVRITIEVKVPNVVFVPDAPQYNAPIGGTGGGDENQGLIVNQAPIGGGDQGFIDVQMPDGNIVKCKIVSQGAGGMNNYGSANGMNQPLINAAGEGNENDAITMK